MISTQTDPYCIQTSRYSLTTLSPTSKWEKSNTHQVFNMPSYYTLCASKYLIDVLIQERRNSTALALKLRLSCINTSFF